MQLKRQKLIKLENFCNKAHHKEVLREIKNME